MVRSIAAVVAGFFSMAILVMIGTMALVNVLVPGGISVMREKMKSGDKSMPSPSGTYLAGNLILSFFAAVIGGWVTAHIATHDVQNHLFALAGVIVLMGVVSAFTNSSTGQPGWYKYVIPLIGVAGVCANVLLFA
jgi:hypothetical protein